MEYEVGEKVFLKVSPWKGILRFGKQGKLSPRYTGPYEIIERIGPLAYRLALPGELSQIHDVFPVSMLQRYRSDPSHVIQEPEVELTEKLVYKEEPIEILGTEEATWEVEEHMRMKYPYLFHDGGKFFNFETKFSKVGRVVTPTFKYHIVMLMHFIHFMIKSK
ncbi:uncharacterized protein LOC130015264 [Mercurialis annua]|uniref:uncharacterized protein LOC130015264 n=1 Tax=Mercurialis annua TaxID=3986 RepID=UPI0024AD80EA|nr:uncharacterized protein LOC130015264 [Mercurialis annua]